MDIMQFIDIKTLYANNLPVVVSVEIDKEKVEQFFDDYPSVKCAIDDGAKLKVELV